MANLFEKLLGQFTYQISSPDIDKDFSVGINRSVRENDNFLQIEQCVNKMLANGESREELFHCSLRPALGHFVVLLLHSFGNDSDPNLRLKSGNFLCLLTQLEFANESADFIAFVLPGIFSGCRKILVNTLPNLHSLDLVRCACKLIANTICVSFSKIDGDRMKISAGKCEKSPSSENVLSFRRDSNWVEMAAQRIFPQVASLLLRLSSHTVDTVRYESANVCSKIRQHIPSDHFGPPFDRFTIDLSLLLFSDPMPKIRQLSCHLIDDVRQQQKDLFESHSLDRLKKAMKSLESDVKKAPDGGVYLQNFVNCVQIVGPNLLGRLFNLPEFVDKFLSPLIRLISVDHSKEMICDLSDLQTKGLTSLPPLKYGLNANHFAELALLLAGTHNSEKLSDWCFDNFRLDCSAERRLSIAFFSFFLLNAPKEGRHQSADIFMEDVLPMLASMESLLEDEVLDHRIANSMVINSTESSLAQLLLHCLSTFRSRPDHMFSARLHIDVIYELLKWCSSSNFSVRNSAETALSRIAESHSHPSTSSLLQCHAQQIVFKLSMDSRDFSVYPRFPLVFAELVTKCSSHQIVLPQIRCVVTELLLWLDRSDQRRITILAKALRAYLNAVNEWFPDLAPPAVTNLNQTEGTNANFDEEEANGENEGIGDSGERLEKERWRDANYPLVKDVVSILNRTKHFISSAHLPLLLIVLDILRLSLCFVRNYEDELLPMIHQNWHAIVRLFDVGNERPSFLLDSQKIVLVKAVGVVSYICKLSKDFVYWKIVHEFIPRAVSLMRILLKESQNLGKLYAQTATYKLQCALLDEIPVILAFAKIAPEHFEPLKGEITVYTQERGLPPRLRDKASSALKHTEKM